jgi:glutathione synthase/RimK-type ligase-like ATP-grasp enzyme
MQAARWKLSQLAIARQQGMVVPETLVTSSPAEALMFAAAAPYGTVLKAVADARVSVGDEERLGFVTDVGSETDWESVALTPVIIQNRIPKQADLRITVVGNELFPALIRVPEGAPVDFRAVDAADCTYERYEIDRRLSDHCFSFLNHFGLRFGAFDFAVDYNGQAWFLECNPAGQWGWIEHFTGMHITASLVDLLLSLR